MLCLVIGLLVLACGSPDTNKNGPANISGATAAATGDQIGVPECDSFLTAYENCVTTKVPEQARPTFQTTMTRWRTDWKKLAADPATRAQLVTACKTHLENARTTMKAYNCTF
jgi:hypothetical protein